MFSITCFCRDANGRSSVDQELLASQRLEQLFSAKESGRDEDAAGDRKQLLNLLSQLVRDSSAGRSRQETEAVVPPAAHRSTIKKISLGDVRARAVLCPVFLRKATALSQLFNGSRRASPAAFAMSYRTLSIGSGAENDVVLTSYAHCNFISDRHAVIFFDEETKKYELLNYSEHGTIVDNVLFSCDFSPKGTRLAQKERTFTSPKKNKMLLSPLRKQPSSPVKSPGPKSPIGIKRKTPAEPGTVSENKRLRPMRSTSLAAKQLQQQQQQQQKEQQLKQPDQEPDPKQQENCERPPSGRTPVPDDKPCVLNPVNRQPIAAQSVSQQQQVKQENLLQQQTSCRTRSQSCEKQGNNGSRTLDPDTRSRSSVQRMDVVVQGSKRRLLHGVAKAKASAGEEPTTMRRREKELVLEECDCQSSASSAIRGTGAGWEGSAPLHHGSLIRFGCIQFVFSITSYGQEVSAPAVTTVTTTAAATAAGPRPKSVVTMDAAPSPVTEYCNLSNASTISAQSTPTKDLTLA